MPDTEILRGRGAKKVIKRTKKEAGGFKPPVLVYPWPFIPFGDTAYKPCPGRFVSPRKLFTA